LPAGAKRGALTLFGTTLAVALVDTYAETIAGMLFRQRRLPRTELREIWHGVAPVLVGAQAPTLVCYCYPRSAFSSRTGDYNC
jgi:hypothetical protein